MDMSTFPSASRRSLVGAVGAAAVLGHPPLHAAGGAWPRNSGAVVGVAPDLGERLDRGVHSGELANLHAVFVARHGKVALERYYTGTDERWGTPLGTVPFDANTLHDLRSVSKSIVGLLYGMALAEGKVPALDTPVLDSFPAYADLAPDRQRRAIHIGHLLSMTMGLSWNEDLPYSDPRNSEIAMENSPDRYLYVLSQPVESAPGTAWRYSGGATAILGHLVARGAGVPLLDFARSRLFAPLGIEQAEWTPGFNGEAAAASGLRLRAGDLARIGQLILDRGASQGNQIVQAHWITASLTPRIPAFEGVQYGYHWYLAPRRDGSTAVMGFGYGGQRLVVVPALDLVYVIFMGNYQQPFPVQLQRVFAVQNLIHGSLVT
jgi:CubicO group peptidase (beta-lactamase class C family)